MNRLIILIFSFCMVIPVCAQQKGQTKAELPKVLILGDWIYQQPSAQIVKELKDKAEVVYHRPEQGQVVDSVYLLEHLDRILGDKQWDVIHFNCGLGDLIYRAPGLKILRVMPPEAGGVRNVDPELYEVNLRQLVENLKQTNAKLIWASTTPIRHSTTNVFQKGSEIEYNQIADKIMKENRVAINDMYSYVVELIDMEKPAGHGADPFHFDKKPIHQPIVDAIVTCLETDSK